VGFGRQICLDMETIRTCDQESVTTSELEPPVVAPKSWKKWMVIGLGAVATLLVMQAKPIGSHDVVGTDLISLAAAGCSEAHENCMASGCCKNDGHKCFMKNQYWANCNPSCDKDFQDDYDKANGITDGWDCKEITPTSGKDCSGDGEDCSTNTKCCHKDMVCYVKHDTWSNCNEKCAVGPGANDYDKDKTEAWSCEVHGLAFANGTALSEGATPADQLAACTDVACEGKTGDDLDTCLADKCVYYTNLVANSTNSTPTPAPTPPPA